MIIEAHQLMLRHSDYPLGLWWTSWKEKGIIETTLQPYHITSACMKQYQYERGKTDFSVLSPGLIPLNEAAKLSFLMRDHDCDMVFW
jgi:hypothetical protein